MANFVASPRSWRDSFRVKLTGSKSPLKTVLGMACFRACPWSKALRG